MTVHANFYTDSEDILAECRLLGSRTLHGQSEPEITTHFTGRVRLVTTRPSIPKEKLVPGAGDAIKVTGDQIYKIYFHGPAYQVIEGAWKDGDQIIGQFAQKLPPNHDPAELPLLASPRYLEMCFQSASLKGLVFQSQLGLPDSFRQFRLLAAPDKDPNATFFAVVTSNPDDSYDVKIVDGKGNICLVLQGYRTMSLPDPVPADLLEPLKKGLKA
ncbi:MAG: hypothetical protein BWY82_02975 [Verrucomicrobia bacterium ADurb.Bin474]|nr:MAG: hypothetical protein BWY82_02975 [Verrucomicrobia bacterium ADurb.Bin474]